MQSTAGSAILKTPELAALISGLRMDSESEREYSVRPPSWRGPGPEASGSVSVSVLVGEENFSRTDLHSWASLECLRHEAFLTIFSRAGEMTWLRRESASEEAIPEFGDCGTAQ